MYESKSAVRGRLTATIITPDPDAVEVTGCDAEQPWRKNREGIWESVWGADNAFLTQGLSNILDRYLASIAAPTYRIGVSSDAAAVTGATTQFGGTSRFSAMNATFPSHTAGTAVASFQADFTKGAGAGQIDFSVRKIGLTTAATDTAGAVQDIIGGTGSSPYNEDITFNMVNASSFTFRPQIDVTLVAV